MPSKRQSRVLIFAYKRSRNWIRRGRGKLIAKTDEYRRPILKCAFLNSPNLPDLKINRRIRADGISPDSKRIVVMAVQYGLRRDASYRRPRLKIFVHRVK